MDGNKINSNCFYSIFAKKYNSHDCFKCIKKHKIIPRRCCLSAFMFLSPKTFLFISMILNLNFYSTSANRRKQKKLVFMENMHQSMSRNFEKSSSMLQSPQKYFFLLNSKKLPLCTMQYVLCSIFLDTTCLPKNRTSVFCFYFMCITIQPYFG